jgi:phosphoadenosine phosphosulfate reductase
MASSLGIEDQALTHLIAEQGLDIPIFSIDTGRLFPETYDLMAATRRRYRVRFRVFCPEAGPLERLLSEHGIDCYRRSVELRKACCRVRKVLPLQRALAGADAWICGLRRGQAPTRRSLEIVDWDEVNKRVKISPLADWDEARLQDFVRTHRVPINPLHARGYPSIGCACCTRAVAPGEDVRAGRWWWELPEDRECGLHRRND